MKYITFIAITLLIDFQEYFIFIFKLASNLMFD